MVDLGKPDVDPSSEQDMSDASSTLPDTQDAYEPVPPKIRGAPTNYLLVSKKGVAIEGRYFIDLSIPPAPQSVFDAVSGLKNFSLYTTSGAVTTDVWVTGNNKLKRVSMKICSDNGRVCAKIERTAPLSDVQGVRVYFIGDRPLSGRWRGDDDVRKDAGAGGPPEEPLDELVVGGWHTSVRIRWDGEPELPQMRPNGWENFCMGTARFFTSGRVN
ncbi:hypothetical protein BJY52DRAFT_1189605 [Lactarius psammicola]|nr:hypothetical protein BJY52DRAFT_1189605 [Lactarius psammicola]